MLVVIRTFLPSTHRLQTLGGSRYAAVRRLCALRAGMSFEAHGDGPSFPLKTLSTDSDDRPVVTMDTGSEGKRMKTHYHGCVDAHTHIHTCVIWFNNRCEKMTSTLWLTSELAYWALIALFNTRKPANVYGNWINETGWSRVAQIQNKTWNQLAQPQVLELTSTKLQEPQIERWTCWLLQLDTWEMIEFWWTWSCNLHYNDGNYKHLHYIKPKV